MIPRNPSFEGLLNVRVHLVAGIGGEVPGRSLCFVGLDSKERFVT
jgi:hypothetical protein